MKKVLGLIAMALLGSALASATTVITPIGTFDVSANATFFEQSSNDNCSSPFAVSGCTANLFTPTIIDLSTYGLVAGDELQLITNGTICWSDSDCGTWPLGGIFDKNGNDLLPNTVQNRLPNSVNAGLPDISNSLYNTYYGNINTTIPNDFYICGTGTVPLPECSGTSGTDVYIPAGAQYLYVAVLDSFYADNTGTLSVTVNEITNVVPEPGAYGLVLSGLAAITFLRRRV